MGAAGMALALLVGVAAPAGAQSGESRSDQPASAERFGEAIDVRVLNLEVQVRDSLGRLVTGLPASAFRVVVGERELPIEHFDEVKRFDPRAPIDEIETPTAPAASSPQSSNYLFFLDNELTMKSRRDLVLEFLSSELDALGPRDQASVVAFDGKRLEVLSDWTHSTELLAQTVAHATTLSANGIMHIARGRMDNFVANWEGNAARRSVLAAAGAMRALPAPAGRKVLILVAGSWDPAELSRSDNFASWCLSGDCGGLRVLRVLTDTANHLDYSIVAVDVEGRDVNLDWEREKRLQDVLTYLAEETGGEVLLNKDRRHMLSRAARAGLNYYSIAVYPPPDLENLRLGVRVFVEGDDLSAHTQGSFVNLGREDDEELEVLNRLLFRSYADDAFPVTVGPPSRLRAGRASVPITIAVPLEKLAWLPTAAGSGARYQIQVATQDVRSHASGVETETFELEREQPPGPADFEFHELEVTVRRRAQTLSVVIRDLQSDATMSVVMPFEPRPRRHERLAESAPAGGS